ncbi:MAG: heparin lyase I family protein [Stellaceae bacterium]
MHRTTVAIVAVILAAALANARAQTPAPPEPIFVETFPYTSPAQIDEKWLISGLLAPELRAVRVGVAADPIGRTVGRITVQEGDALDGATDAMKAAKRYVCDAEGSRAAEMEAEPGGIAPSERAEIQVKSDRKTGAGEVVKFGETIWYRFAFKVSSDWPRDVPVSGRQPCRTVIHQIKQDAFLNGESCGASPFFKVEARPLGDHVRFFAQIAVGDACSTPARVKRTLICVTNDVPRETWTTVNVRLLPAHDASGRVEVWLNGRPCGSYSGPMGDPEHGAQRNGIPFINAQPRFGIYRDWRAETQTIYFDKIMFWDRDPAGNRDWGLGAGQ